MSEQATDLASNSQSKPVNPVRTAIATGFVGLSVLLSACGAQGNAQGNTDGGSGVETVGIAQPRNILSLPVLIAQEQGIFEKHGVSIEQVPIENSAASVAAVQSGSADVALLAAATGLPAMQDSGRIKAMSQLVDLDYTLLARTDLELPNRDAAYPEYVKDLAGLDIGIPVRGGGAETFITKMLTDAGMSHDDVTFVATGVGANAAAAFSAGQVDLTFAEQPVQALIGQGNYVQIVDAKEAIEIQGSNFYAFIAGNEKFLTERPTVAEKFCSGLRESVEWMKEPANSGTVVESISKTLNLTPEQAAMVWDDYSATFNTAPIDEKVWQSALDVVERGPSFTEAVYAPCQAA